MHGSGAELSRIRVDRTRTNIRNGRIISASDTSIVEQDIGSRHDSERVR